MLLAVGQAKEVSIQQACGGVGGLAAARQQIEGLRRWYGLATDYLGSGEGQAEITEARRIYQQIFTPQAKIRTSGGDGPVLTASGPNEWADVVLDALQSFNATQHLIGTQLVTIDELTGEQGEVNSGHAHMSSYLQAWHSNAAGQVYMVMGTYLDRVSFSADAGWQIYDMELVSVASDWRQLGVRD